MPKLIVSIDGVVIKEAQLTKDRTTLGRRPYNDIVIDNLAVSGEHAVLQMAGGEVVLEDLNSTNGTYVNGKTVKKQSLQAGDTIEIGKYKIRFLGDAVATGRAALDGLPSSAAPLTGEATLRAAVKVLNGAAAGREVELVKVVTTIGKPGVAVASITRRPQGFVIAHVDGATSPLLNGAPVTAEHITLKNGDMLELAGVQMQFVQA